MEREVLSLATLGEVDDGAIGVAYDLELQKLLHDLRDRPDLDKPRKITLEVALTPVCDRGQLARATMKCKVKLGIPDKESVGYPVLTTKNGLEFMPAIADNPRQAPLPFTKDGDE